MYRSAQALPVIGKINDAIINPLIRLLFGLALIFFLWGVFEFVSAAGDESRLTKGKQHMVWGVLGMAIMVSAFGIVNLIISTVRSF
ncbi:MAG: hypothetical protein HYS59_01950 [Candidatus Vogelbacteria bacterium]|nr:hypothetical protein [Candidatus Vogelbacteria bacterium]